MPLEQHTRNHPQPSNARSDIESQLELLYNTYYEELENFANQQISSPDIYRQHPHSNCCNPRDRIPHLADKDDEELEDELEDMYEDVDGESNSNVSSEVGSNGDGYARSTASDDSGILEFGISLTVKGLWALFLVLARR